MTDTIKTTYTHCNICVAGCGLAVKTNNNKVIDIKPDKDNYFWKDFCIKAAESHKLIDHPLRITSPMKRVGDKYVEVSYPQMIKELSTQLNQLIDQHGPDSIGSYIGNPGLSNFGTTAFHGLFLDAIETKNRFFVGSVDQNAMHVVNEHMFNHPWALVQTDVDNCQYLMMVGANPAVSEFGWLYSLSNGWKRALKAKKTGSTLVFVDPRTTESAKKASLHIAPLPGTDWAFLAGIIHVIISNNWFDKNAVNDFTGFDDLKKSMASLDLTSLSKRCDVSVETIRQVAHDFSHASSASCVANTGVGVTSTGSIGIWLSFVVTLITGNMRRKGGMYHTRGAMNLLKNGSELFPVKHHTSRVHGSQSVAGYFHLNELPDEINTEGEGQIKAFFMVAGNPVISGPQGDKLDEALSKLDLLIAVDSFQRESHRHAHWLIPGTHFLELNEMAPLLKDINGRPSAQLLKPAVEKPANVAYEWEFFRDLTLAMGKPLLMGKKILNPMVKLINLIGKIKGDAYEGFSPKTFATSILKKGGATTYKEVAAAEHGLLLDEPTDFNYFLDNLPTQDGKVAIAPAPLMARLDELLASPEIREDIKEFPLQLINKRKKHMMNSWLTHSSMQKMKNKDGDRVEVNTEDASALGLADGDTVTVSSAVASIEVTLKTTDDVRRGVIVMGHGWGGRTFDPKNTDYSESEGVNRNLLVSNAQKDIDPLSGTPKLNGTAVKICALN